MPSTFPFLHFDEAFLSWFRERTEAAWSRYPAITLEQYPNSEVAINWQQGTRWLPGLTEIEITAIEKRWNVSFPPDYRLFLSKFHSPDRPQTEIFRDEDGLLRLYHYPSFFNWQTDEAVIQDCYDALWDWWSGTEAERTHFQEVIHAAPKVIPLYGNRYLLTEPCQEGNPVFSIYHSDIIVYAANFRDYLIRELIDLIDQELHHHIDEMDELLSERYGVMQLKIEDYFDIPFWGEYLAANARSWRRTIQENKTPSWLYPT